MSTTVTASIDQPWSDEDVRLGIEALLLSDETDPQWYVDRIMDTLFYFGYDSIDRECSFVLVSEKLGVKYDVLYDIWLAGPPS